MAVNKFSLLSRSNEIDPTHTTDKDTELTYPQPAFSFPISSPPTALETADLTGRAKDDCSFNRRPHIIPIRTSGDRPPLFCIFPGPPGSSEFADLLQEQQPLYDFYFTKLDGAANFPPVEQLAVSFLEEIRRVQPHGPYQLCGYSKAGLVAYEIARLLLSAGEDVRFLALFETWHPGFEQNLTRIGYARFRLLYLVDRFEKYGRSLLRGKFSDAFFVAWKGIAKRARLIGWRVIRRFFETASQQVPQGMQQAESIVVLKSFVPKPFPKRFILVRTDDSFEKKIADPTLGWDMCALEGVDVYFVHGDQDHGTMMDKPHVRLVIDKISAHLADPNKP
jgi:thioesterase domain-containing protein